MKIKCEYCGGYFDDELERCPNCGSLNNNIRRGSSEIPKTIDELKDFCSKKNVPAEKLGFHIGEDYKGPKAFGIYFDERTRNYIVYKNKSDGSRAIRYEGKDEGYAVNEIYLKLKEISNISRKSKKTEVTVKKNSYSVPKKTFSASNIFKKIFEIYIHSYIVVLALVVALSMTVFSGPKNGYYSYNNLTYYYQDDTWYSWDDTSSSWNPDYSLDFDANEDYYLSSYYDSSYGVDSFYNSFSYNSDSDYSYDYSYDYYSDWDDDWDSNWDSYDYDYSYDYDWDSDW